MKYVEPQCSPGNTESLCYEAMQGKQLWSSVHQNLQQLSNCNLQKQVKHNLYKFPFCSRQKIVSSYQMAAHWYKPIFLVFKSVGDIGPLLLREAGLLLVQDILRGFLCPRADPPCPTSPAGWPSLCCSSYYPAPGGNKGQHWKYCSFNYLMLCKLWFPDKMLKLLKVTWEAERWARRAFPSWIRFLFSAFFFACSGWLSFSDFSSHSWKAKTSLKPVKELN